MQIIVKFDGVERMSQAARLSGLGSKSRWRSEARSNQVGYSDLIGRMRRVSELSGGGAGPDIKSEACDCRPRLIEVKATNGWGAPFQIPCTDLALAKKLALNCA